MALKKLMVTDKGTRGDYWRVVQLNMNFDRLDAVASFSLYMTREARVAGRSQMQNINIDLGEEFLKKQIAKNGDLGDESNKRTAYNALKRLVILEKQVSPEEQNPDILFFDGAEDV